MLAGSAALAVPVAHRRRTAAPPPVDLEQVIASARRIVDVRGDRRPDHAAPAHPQNRLGLLRGGNSEET